MNAWNNDNASQEAYRALAKIEEAAWLALEELQSWNESYPDDKGTEQALKALRCALGV